MTPRHRLPLDAAERSFLNPVFARIGEAMDAPKNRFPYDEMLPETAFQIVHDEVMMDGNARFNLATFVTTWMDDHANRLMAESVQKNMIDKDEYPQTAEIERRCVAMVADLWNSPDPVASPGVSCTGSSEACMLAGMALKRRWQARRTAAGADTSAPNIVFGANVQVVWEKFARYWEVEPRYVPLEGDVLHLTADRMLPFIDENTIGVVGILGSTFDGSYEPIADIAAALDRLAADSGPDVPLHVDAASGGFVAPFIQPDLVWDFRLERVASISASGHKYGLVYPGIGWVSWRVPENLPEELVFKVNYLGGEMPTFALNFSRPGSQVVAQYYMFLRLGFEGYRRVQQVSHDVAVRIADEAAKLGPLRVITDATDLPIVTLRLDDSVNNYTVFDVSDRLRERGWLVPAYTFPANREDLAVLRIVVRNGFSRDMADLFLDQLRTVVHGLENLDAPLPDEAGRRRRSFRH